MPAQGEEVVVHPHPLPAQQVAPDPRQHLLRRRTRCVVHRPRRRLPRCRQRLAVHLPRPRQRQRRQLHPHRRHHERWQARTEIDAERCHVERSAPFHGRHVRHQPPVPRRVGRGGHRRLPHRRMPRQHGLDLAQLDAEAPHLHLVVHPPQELERPVGAPTRPVSRAVETGAAQSAETAERIRHEALRGQLRPVEIAPGQRLAAQAELARHPHRQHFEAPVQHERRRARQRPADVRLAVDPRGPRRHLRPRRVRRVLRRSIEIPQPRHAGPVDPLRQGAAQRLAGQVHRPDRRRQRAEVEQARQRRRHRVDQRHLRRRRQPGERQRVVRHDHRATRRQRHEDLEDRQVEAGRGREQNPRKLRRGVPGERPLDQTQSAAVRDRHALGNPGRSRRVDQVRQAFFRGRPETSAEAGAAASPRVASSM